MKPRNPVKRFAKMMFRSLIYRFAPVYLSPAGLHIWFEALHNTESVPGDVVEIGCYLGATAALGSRMLKEIGSTRTYSVIDTFGGFVEEQFETEARLGGMPSLRFEFSGNTPELARWVMDRHGGEDVKMVVGDIATIPEAQLPDRISACLIDIDIAEPIHTALQRIYPRLTPNGIIVVDDCAEDGGYLARLGYDRFVQEQGLPREIRFGKGIVRKPEQVC
jgi:SAM-dependent methyltransferase